MQIAIFGMGYVGAVSAACFARMGLVVTGVDVSDEKVNMMNAGVPPVKEEGLLELFERYKGSALRATKNVSEAISEADFAFVCVGTPSDSKGCVDLSAVKAVSEQIGMALKSRKKISPLVVVVRSTVPPGTSRNLIVPAIEKGAQLKHGSGFSVVHNPEFLREGSSIDDFFNPSMTVLGETGDAQGAERVLELYRELPGKKQVVKSEMSELVKYCCNAFHALKVTFANEVGMLAAELAVDARQLMEIFCLDDKLNISKAYMRPGFAFGGSCLPKDLRGLVSVAKQNSVSVPMLESVGVSNRQQIENVCKIISEVGGKKVGVVGLSFKYGTDDLRESPMVDLVEYLIGKGCVTKVYDKYVSVSRLVGSNRSYLEKKVAHINEILCDELQEVLDGVQILVLGAYDSAVDEMVREKNFDHIIDLSGKYKALESRPGYHGLYW